MRNKNIRVSKKAIRRGSLILVNRDFLLEDNYDSDLILEEIDKSCYLEKECKRALDKLVKDYRELEELVYVSGYRSLEEQTNLYSSSLIENGEEFTNKFVAIPNASEHQSGYAIDLAVPAENIDFICPDFPNEGIGKLFRTVAGEYGFIERYQKEKEQITKISTEPWHFRYVGFPHSKIIEMNSFCLEEYIIYLKQFSVNNPLIYENRCIYFVPILDKNITISLKEDEKFMISGNNWDGVIVTTWKG